MNVESACAGFLQYCRAERHLSANTLAAYDQDLGDFRRWSGARPITGITGEELVAYSRDLSVARKLAPATVKRRLACLRAMFKRLERHRALTANPFNDVDLRVRIPARLPRCLANGEVRALLVEAGVSSTIRLAVLLLVSTGVRVGELAAIRLADLDLEQHLIRIIGKGNRERRVFLPDPGLALALRRYIARHHGRSADPANRLLVNMRGEPASAAWLRHQMKILAQRAGLTRTVTPHMLRHTAATALIEAGVDIRFVQRLLGHRSIATTQIYTHVSDRALKSAIVRANVFGSVAIGRARVDNY